MAEDEPSSSWRGSQGRARRGLSTESSVEFGGADVDNSDE